MMALWCPSKVSSATCKYFYINILSIIQKNSLNNRDCSREDGLNQTSKYVVNWAKRKSSWFQTNETVGRHKVPRYKVDPRKPPFCRVWHHWCDVIGNSFKGQCEIVCMFFSITIQINRPISMKFGMGVVRKGVRFLAGFYHISDPISQFLGVRGHKLGPWGSGAVGRSPLESNWVFLQKMPIVI